MSSGELENKHFFDSIERPRSNPSPCSDALDGFGSYCTSAMLEDNFLRILVSHRDAGVQGSAIPDHMKMCLLSKEGPLIPQINPLTLPLDLKTNSALYPIPT